MSPSSVSPRPRHDLDPNRWRILGVLCLAVFTIVLDGTIVNVALPTFVRELGATTSELQWIVDAYVLVFAGLLMAAGSLGDRFGRKGMLQAGLALFGVCSVFAAAASTPGGLIAWRGAMGVGAALLFPATLAILVNVFTEARERAIAIAVWAAASGIGVALGPVTGGLLLEHFWWGSVFLVNVPVVIGAALAVWRFVPTSRDPSIGRFDALGTVLSIAAIGVTVWAVIEGPVHGWTSASSVASFGAAAVLVAAFIVWERHNSDPMLDVSVFTNMRFTAGSVTITFAFFALFGFIFVVTQYFQFVRGYGALEAGLRTVPFAIFTAGAAPFAARLAGRFGTKRVVTAGLTAMSLGFAWTTTLAVDTPYWVIVCQMALMGGGLGLAQAPATESIMGALPPERAGVGSAVNDTARELGGTLGVAVIGSVFASIYASGLGDALAGGTVSAEAIGIAESSVGAGIGVADRVAESVGPEAGAAVRTAVHESFLDGFHAGSWVSATVVLVGAVLALRYLPAHAATEAIPGEPVDVGDDEHSRPADTVNPTDATRPGPTPRATPRDGRRRNEVLQLRARARRAPREAAGLPGVRSESAR
jgi:DHA2 family multidrug resistance protein-like MFS transporter